MQPAPDRKTVKIIPKKRQKHYSYNEEVTESPTLIEDEAVDVEGDIPAEENEPIETSEQEDDSVMVPFEE